MSGGLSSRERLETVFAGGCPDRTPILGGWIACPEHICSLTQTTLEDYWRDPIRVSIRAYEILGADGLIGVFVPSGPGQYRCVDNETYHRADTGISFDETLRRIEEMPSPERIEADFDFAAAYESFSAELKATQALCGDMVWMPAQWSAGAKVTWFFDFGYEQYFTVVGLCPDHARKLLEVGGAQGRCQSRLIARAVREGLYPHAVLLGEDICTQRGPMISPAFMEKHYAPQLRYGLTPLLEAGCKPVWHCDGDVRPLLDMLLDCGVQGFQGFQPECGMKLEQIVQKRTREGEKLLIFGPLAVTTELPVLTPAQIRPKVREAIEICRGSADLVLCTSNTINPDVPLENIRAMYEEVLSPR